MILVCHLTTTGLEINLLSLTTHLMSMSVSWLQLETLTCLLSSNMFSFLIFYYQLDSIPSGTINYQCNDESNALHYIIIQIYQFLFFCEFPFFFLLQNFNFHLHILTLNFLCLIDICFIDFIELLHLFIYCKPLCFLILA